MLLRSHRFFAKYLFFSLFFRSSLLLVHSIFYTLSFSMFVLWQEEKKWNKAPKESLKKHPLFHSKKDTRNSLPGALVTQLKDILLTMVSWKVEKEIEFLLFSYAHSSLASVFRWIYSLTMYGNNVSFNLHTHEMWTDKPLSSFVWLTVCLSACSCLFFSGSCNHSTADVEGESNVDVFFIIGSRMIFISRGRKREERKKDVNWSDGQLSTPQPAGNAHQIDVIKYLRGKGHDEMRFCARATSSLPVTHLCEGSLLAPGYQWMVKWKVHDSSFRWRRTCVAYAIDQGHTH